MINNFSIKALGKREIKLMFKSNNTLVQNNVLFSSHVVKNLVSGPNLNVLGYKLIIESSKCIIS